MPVPNVTTPRRALQLDAVDLEEPLRVSFRGRERVERDQDQRSARSMGPSYWNFRFAIS